MSIPRFCIQNRITDKEATPCSVERWKALAASPEVQSVCDQIKLLDGKDAEELARLKKQLPVAIYHAQRFNNNERKNQNAIPSGLAMLDIDDVENPTSLFESFGMEAIKANAIYLAAVTPSGHGLRLVFERTTVPSDNHRPETIAEAQSRVAHNLGLSSFDSSTKDLARASFLVPLSYVLYLDEAGLEFPDEVTAKATAERFANVQNAPGTPAINPEQRSDQEQPEKPVVLAYRGIPYKDIIHELVTLLGGSPEVGERNTFYFTLVRYARYICDFNPEQLLAILPDFGLSVQERRSIITSAVNRPRKADLPDIITRALTAAKASTSASEEAEHKAAYSCDDLPLPKLPKVLETICHRLPDEFRPAMVIASLPVLGALATRVRFDYLDHQEHSFSFMSCITAPAATGKSFIRRPVNLLLTPIDEQDEVEREKEQEYKDKLRAAKNAKMQPENPRACPRNNGINISIAKLLQLLSYSEGKHLIGIGEEIDTLVKSERAGVWSQKSDIYRLGFDNAKYGQNYMSDNSFSANVPVYYNLLLTGTPGGMYRFFKDVEDGLVTRFAFAQLPDMFGTDIPDFQPYTQTEENDIIRMARMLDMAQGKIHCSAIDEAIARWLIEKKQMAIENDSRAIDTIRKRAAVMGFRAGYLAALMNGSAKRTNHSAKAEAKEQAAVDFALWVAEYIFRNQMQLFGDKFEQVANQYIAESERRGAVRNLLTSLPQEFSKAELMALRARNGQSTHVATVITRWTQAGLIKKVSPNHYQRL